MNDRPVIFDLEHAVIERLAVRINEHNPHTDPVMAIPVNIAAPGSAVVVTVPGDLLGWSLVTAAAGLAAALRDGDPANGITVAMLALTANAAETKNLGPHGVRVTNELALNVTAGAVTGALYYRPLRRHS